MAESSWVVCRTSHVYNWEGRRQPALGAVAYWSISKQRASRLEVCTEGDRRRTGIRLSVVGPRAGVCRTRSARRRRGTPTPPVR